MKEQKITNNRSMSNRGSNLLHCQQLQQPSYTEMLRPTDTDIFCLYNLRPFVNAIIML